MFKKYYADVSSLEQIILYNNNQLKINFDEVKMVCYNTKWWKKNPTKITLLDWEHKIIEILNNER